MCPLCHSAGVQLVYSVDAIPLFQNKVYADAESARQALTGGVALEQCTSCNFVFNSAFDSASMAYDADYQNEQANSEYFQAHLANVLNIIRPHVDGNQKVIEIGCGKGHFLDMLVAEGFDVTGFDPAFEGENPNIRKDYFSDKYSHIEADFIVLRHTLEHIDEPLDFLHKIAKANGYKGKIYIEVPDVGWIFDNVAFWDIFYEHCNYFSQETLGALFDIPESGLLFDGQYQYVIADLAGLKPREQLEQSGCTEFPDLSGHLDVYKRIIADAAPVIVWGAGAKGSTFVNLVDPDADLVTCVIDINPRKAGRYVAKTGHPILSPDAVFDAEKGVAATVVIMNKNYESEILAYLQSTGSQVKACSLDDLTTATL